MPCGTISRQRKRLNKCKRCYFIIRTDRRRRRMAPQTQHNSRQRQLSFPQPNNPTSKDSLLNVSIKSDCLRVSTVLFMHLSAREEKKLKSAIDLGATIKCHRPPVFANESIRVKQREIPRKNWAIFAFENSSASNIDNYIHLFKLLSNKSM